MRPIEYYLSSPDFVSLLRLWETEFRCPFVLQDWFLDWDEEVYAEAVAVALQCKDRPLFVDSIHGGLEVGLYPATYSDNRYPLYNWWQVNYYSRVLEPVDKWGRNSTVRNDCCDLPFVGKPPAKWGWIRYSIDADTHCSRTHAFLGYFTLFAKWVADGRGILLR